MRGDSDSGCLTLLLVLALAGGVGWWEWSRYEADEKAKADAQAAREQAASSEQERQNALSQCLDDSERDYWLFVRLNRDKTKDKTDDGLVRASNDVWRIADGKKLSAIAECQARYGARTQ